MASQGNNLDLGRSRDRSPIVLKHNHRLQHAWIVGNTGAGKSRYLQGLVRQDIKAWPRTRCGLVLVDPHGDTFDGIMAWIAANRLFHLPIVPIDFRRRDQIVSYNVLRQRSAEPSVIIDNFVRAMAHVWGQAGTSETPLLERWALNALYTLYHEKKTLADAAQLFTPGGHVAIERIADPMVRRDWEWARRNHKDFEIAISSSINRFRRFLLNPVMRSMFGQQDVSLDLGTALDKGQIILVSLGTDRGYVSRQNVDLFATLLLSDLQVACDERGKSDSVKPFYVFLDEFWRFLTPTMAENLAASRGFGVGMTMVNQFPRQILNGGQYGQRIFDEVMENTRSKIVFRLRSPENLELAANQLHFSTFDPLKVKHQHYSTKVLGHTVQYMSSFGHSATKTKGGGKQLSHTSGRSHSVGSNWSHTDSSSHSIGTSESHTDSSTVGTTTGSARSVSLGVSDSDQWSSGETRGTSRGLNWSESDGETAGGSGIRSRSANVSQDLGEPPDELKKQITRGGRRPNYHELLENSDGYGKHQLSLNDATKRVAVSESLAEGKSDSWGQSRNRARGGDESESSQHSLSRGGGTSRSGTLSESSHEDFSTSVGTADTVGTQESWSEGMADSYGGGETDGKSEADTVGKSKSWSTAKGNSITSSPMLIPITGKEANAPIFWTIDEQRFLAMRNIFGLQDREAYILAGDMRAPVLIRTDDVNRPSISHVCMEVCTGWYQRESGLALPLEEAHRRVLERDQEFNLVTIVVTDDIERPRRRINPKGIAASADEKTKNVS